ncbi:MAG: hemerythrin domain-containing protein [Sphingobium sp.]
MDMELLKKQHEELECAAAALLQAVVANDRKSVPQLRWRLARSLIAHLAVEDKFLYPKAIAGNDRAVADLALAFQQEMGGLADAFSKHMSNWTDQKITDDWPGYSAEIKHILACLGQRIERENEELYPLFEGKSLAPKRRLAG